MRIAIEVDDRVPRSRTVGNGCCIEPIRRWSQKSTPHGTLSYAYDAAGNLASMTSNHVHGVSVSYQYDGLNRLATVADGALTGAQTATYAYDSANNIGSVTYPNGIVSQFTYDSLNRVTGLSSQISGYAYQRGPTGNLASATEQNGRTSTWTYDGINRLTSETVALDPQSHNGSVSYSLDPVGNRLSDNSSLSSVSTGAWSYNANDEVSSESYDNNGNVIAASGKTFAYDSQNQLVSMNGGQVSLVYDGDGNRVAKTANGAPTYYLVDDLNPTGYAQVVEELSASGTVERQYSYGLQRISKSQTINNAWTTSYYGYDGGGNVRNLTDATGTVTDTYAYDAYGNPVTTSGSTPNTYLYRTESFDADLGMCYLRARYYNPLTGRFISRDPEDGVNTDPATLHKYVYANGDPMNHVDPSGRSVLIGTLAIDSIDTVKDAVEAAAFAAVMACQADFISSDIAAQIQYYWDTLVRHREAEIFGEPPCGVGEKSRKKCHPGMVYRIYGKKSPLWSQYWTYTDPRTIPDWFNAAGVGSWNDGRNIALGYLADPEGCECGLAKPAIDEDGTFLPGGGTDEVFCPNPQGQIKLLLVGKTPKGFGGKRGVE